MARHLRVCYSPLLEAGRSSISVLALPNVGVDACEVKVCNLRRQGCHQRSAGLLSIVELLDFSLTRRERKRTIASTSYPHIAQTWMITERLVEKPSGSGASGRQCARCVKIE